MFDPIYYTEKDWKKAGYVFKGIVAFLVVASIVTFFSLRENTPFGADVNGLVDYKFNYIQRSDDGIIEKASVRFFIGAITTENEPDEKGNLVPVTRYRRLQRITNFPPAFDRLELDAFGNVTVVFTPQDFGVISTDDELRLYLNQKLAQVAQRLKLTPIAEQTGTTLK